ncbi:MAG: NDP-sugar synthase [Candidatus Margulisbacteria bacterium]|nr:NDP-sugar synthase [Candidatus Margulisiibacteriota bacterium]MBU1021940.1 NDP-sugar synthase [Candidatus Margulisiibacteriota bacterium]MBU1728919.1 NDP-sugar synthase [Candidatus Margulisiibacteriota bacterium]MBU1954725.1 NDP-sugar synthase [Candidatus Margulisiibacteriota bacterium]
MKAVIIAGGLGTRLRPLTYNTPKVIVPLVNKPFIFYQVELLLRHGIKDIILNLHYLPEKVQEVIAELEALGAKISVSLELDPLGTAGAVKNAEQFFDDEPLMVFNGDVLTDLDLSALIEFHQTKKAEVTIALTRAEDPKAFGLVVTNSNQKITQFIEKPSASQIVTDTINAGTYIINPKLFSKVPKGKFWMFERSFFPQVLEEGLPMYGYVSDAFWLDCGTPEKYFEAHRAILRRDIKVDIFGEKYEDEVYKGKGVSIAKSVKILGPSVLGNQVKIGEDAYIQDLVVLGEGVEVGAKSNIEHAVIWRGTRIGKEVWIKGAIIGNGCIIEDNAAVGPGVILADGSIVKRGSILGSA